MAKLILELEKCISNKRGRIYCQGYHVTYQGAPWNKAVMEFARKEVIHG